MAPCLIYWTSHTPYWYQPQARGLHKDQDDHNGLAELTLSEILRVTVREAAAQYASHRHCRGQFPRDVVGVLILCFDLTVVTMGTKTCFEIPSHSGAEARFVPPVTAGRRVKFWPGMKNSSFSLLFCVFITCYHLKLGEIHSVKVLAWKSGSVKFWTNLMSVQGRMCAICRAYINAVYEVLISFFQRNTCTDHHCRVCVTNTFEDVCVTNIFETSLKSMYEEQSILQRKGVVKKRSSEEKE